MKKETLTGVKRELKEEKEKSARLYRENEQYKRDLRDYQETKSKLYDTEILCAELRGNMAGISYILDKFSLDMSIKNKNKSEDEIYHELRDKRQGRNW